MFNTADVFAIYTALNQGETLFTDVDGIAAAQIQRQGDAYVMTGVTGGHSINATNSDARRVAAHWYGFGVTNRAKLRGMIERGEPLPGVRINATVYGEVTDYLITRGF